MKSIYLKRTSSIAVITCLALASPLPPTTFYKTTSLYNRTAETTTLIRINQNHTHSETRKRQNWKSNPDGNKRGVLAIREKKRWRLEPSMDLTVW